MCAGAQFNEPEFSAKKISGALIAHVGVPTE